LIDELFAALSVMFSTAPSYELELMAVRRASLIHKRTVAFREFASRKECGWPPVRNK